MKIMYKLTGLINDGSIFCGMHHDIGKCEMTVMEMYKFMHDNNGIQNMVFVAEHDNEYVYSWLCTSNDRHMP